MLHRAIDTLPDVTPLERAPRNFTQDTTIIGVIVDVFFDHFLQKIDLILMKIR
jgi:acyl carrier protein phosphodiesterase